jgi:hypothetical protein
MSAFAERAIGENWRRRFGRIWGAFNCLALQGWLELDGLFEDTRYRLTPVGCTVVELIRRRAGPFQKLRSALPVLASLHAHLRIAAPERAVIDTYADLVRDCCHGWELGQGTKTAERNARAILGVCLDGIVLCPTLVALGMPVFEQSGARIDVRAPAVVDWNSSAIVLDPAVSGESLPGNALLAPMCDLLETKGLIVRTGSGRSYEGTAEGTPIARSLVAGGALVGSYARTYVQIESHLFDVDSEMSIETDAHIDRLMNVFGTSRGSSEPALAHLCRTHLCRIFDRVPLADQPLGIADMGCGDGRALRAMGEYVLRHTERGRHKQDYPLVLLGADFHEGPLFRTRSELSCFEGIAGVNVNVVKADLTDPEDYDRAVRSLGLARVGLAGRGAGGLSDFLHTFMFIVHNRRIRLAEEDAAGSLLVARFGDSGIRTLVSAVLREHFDVVLGERTAPDEMLALSNYLFPSTYVRNGAAVPGFVAAADLVAFLLRWRPFAPHGFLSVEGHVPTGDSARPSRSPRHPQPHPYRWGIHYISDQYLLSLREYLLCLALAGFVAAPGRSLGRLYPEGFPLQDDQSSTHRSRSVIHAVSAEDMTHDVSLMSRKSASDSLFLRRGSVPGAVRKTTT